MAEDQLEITRQEFVDWKENKITQSIFSILQERQDMLKEFLANGGSLSKDAPKDSTAFTVGRIQGINEILNIEYEEPAQPYEH
jgi:hypothetical protein